MDKSLLGDLDLLPEEDKVRMSAMIEQLQIRDRSLIFSFSSSSRSWLLHRARHAIDLSERSCFRMICVIVSCFVIESTYSILSP